MHDVIATCSEVGCKNHNGDDGCKLKHITLSTDLFCLSYQRRVEAEYKQLMRESEPKGYRRSGKWVSN